MKHIGSVLYDAIAERGLVKARLAEQMGMTRSYFSSLFKKSSIDAKQLEDLCKLIGISPAVVFDDFDPGASVKSVVGDVSTTAILGDGSVNIGNRGSLKPSRDVIAAKDQVILEKEKLIREKERTIKLLLTLLKERCGGDLKSDVVSLLSVDE